MNLINAASEGRLRQAFLSTSAGSSAGRAAPRVPCTTSRFSIDAASDLHSLGGVGTTAQHRRHVTPSQLVEFRCELGIAARAGPSCSDASEHRVAVGEQVEVERLRIDVSRRQERAEHLVTVLGEERSLSIRDRAEGSLGEDEDRARSRQRLLLRDGIVALGESGFRPGGARAGHHGMLRTEGAQQDLDGAIDFRGGLVEFAPLGEQLRHRETGRREIGVARLRVRAAARRALLRAAAARGPPGRDRIPSAPGCAPPPRHRDGRRPARCEGPRPRRRTGRPQLDSSPNPNARGPDSSEP